jgi:outer membrane immunogenic protein
VIVSILLQPFQATNRICQLERVSVLLLQYGLTPNIILGVDYQHAFMGTKSITFLPNVALPVISRMENIRQDVDVVTARLSYKFGGPVVAKY